MDRLDPSLTQVWDQPVHVVLGDAERDVVLCSVPVHHGVHTEKPEHPAPVSISVEEQSARLVPPAEAQLESELPNVEIDGPIQVRHWQVNLVETVVKAHRRGWVIQLRPSMSVLHEGRLVWLTIAFSCSRIK